MRIRNRSRVVAEAAGLIVISLMLVPGAKAQYTEKILHPFTGGNSGYNPYGSLVFDAAGNLYGTTYWGGKTSYCTFGGCGLVYKLAPTSTGGWKGSTIHVFAGTPDGANPLAGLIADAAGNFYGTTQSGGNPAYCQFGIWYGCGTVFKLSPASGGSWKTTVLYTFTGAADGANPQGSLAMDLAGNLYGTTNNGGANYSGVVFELSPVSHGYKVTALHTFGAGTDGKYPFSGLTFDAAGNLYGTTQYGGAYGHGSVFELSPSSGGRWKYKFLYSFNNTDGELPLGNLILDAAGNLYGTTTSGGSGNGLGVIFELSPTSSGNWTETVLYDAYPQGTAGPGSSLIFDASGSLFTTVVQGGPFGLGAVLKLSPSSPGWTPTLLYSFQNSSTGIYPQAGVILDPAGNLYGTAFGWNGSEGTVFELSPTGAHRE